MKTKVILSTISILSFTLISSGLIYSGISLLDDKKSQTECPYLKEEFDKLNSECPYLSGKSTCPYSDKESKIETETSDKGKRKEKKSYRTIKNIST